MSHTWRNRLLLSIYLWCHRWVIVLSCAMFRLKVVTRSRLELSWSVSVSRTCILPTESSTLPSPLIFKAILIEKTVLLIHVGFAIKLPRIEKDPKWTSRKLTFCFWRSWPVLLRYCFGNSFRAHIQRASCVYFPLIKGCL